MKINLTDIANLDNENSVVAAINNNNQTLETALENTLSRDGTSPNQMGADFDMNSHRIINLPFPTSDTEPARLVDVRSGISGTIAVGTVTTLAAGSPATVVNVGTASAAILNFGIPQGNPGTLTASGTPTVGQLGVWTNATTQKGVSISGLVKGNGASDPTAAVANTDYLPVANPTATGTLTAAAITASGVITATSKGHIIGQASGTAATGAVAVGDSNIVLYGSGTNWAGIGTDASGSIWFKVGTSGTPVPAFYLSSTTQTVNFVNSPADANGTIFSNIPQNSQSAAYTLVLGDANKHIFHPSADTTARTWTIPANASVAFPIGTAVTFINQNSAGVITISITTDTLRLAGAGTTGNRTLGTNGVATAIKVTSTEWIISGTGLT